jgi:hypothetical protein
MSRRILSLLAVAVLLPGCVAVNEPLSDPDKAKSEQRLLGKWQRDKSNNQCEIDAPAVMGHPKGLMRAVNDGKADDPLNAFWFFTTAIGKHTYATIYVAMGDSVQFADFRKEGAFEKWNQNKNRRYFIVQYLIDGDKLTVDEGDATAVQKLVGAVNMKQIQYLQTPPGWLAKYLETNGPQAVYNGTNVQHWQRPKK